MEQRTSSITLSFKKVNFFNLDCITNFSNVMPITLLVIIVISCEITMGTALEIDESVSINKPVSKARNQPWVHFSSEYVRCFCNLPACVTTGYMCKSSGGGCFSNLWKMDGSPTSYRGRHGCVELLTDKEQKVWCQNKPEISKTSSNRKQAHSKSLLHCCYHDMCNHVDSPQTRILLNNTLLDDPVRNTRIENAQRHEAAGYSNSEMWFRAATIAVPICGAVILFVLVALAVKILRSERRNSPNQKLGPAMYVHQLPSQNKSCEKYHMDHYDNILRRPYADRNHIYNSEELQRQIQVPLLVQNDHPQCDNKNEHYAKLNLMHCDNLQDYLGSGKSIILEIEKENSKEFSQLNTNVNNLDSSKLKFSNIRHVDKNYVKDT